MSESLVVASIAVLVLVAAWLSAAEVAIARISRTKAHHLAQEKRSRSAEHLVRIVEDPSSCVAVLVLLSLMASVGGTALAAALAIERFGDGGAAIAAAVMTFVLFVFAQLVPRTFAVQRTEGLALAVARPVKLLSKVLGPVIKLLTLASNAIMGLLPGRALPKGPFISEEEIRQLTVPIEQEEEVEEEDRELLHSVFEFGGTVVREVMVPRTDMVAITAQSSVAEALETIVEAGYSRIPIYEGDTDNITGVLYAKDLLMRTQELPPDARVSSLGREPMFVPEQKKVADLLRDMQQQRIHMAIVVDEYGGTAGLVTIEDLIEEIVGEIVDEYDQEEPLVEPIDERTIRVDAKMPIDEVNELLDVNLPHEEWDTVGGLVFGLTGRVPVVGEVVRYEPLEFRTERVTGRRIQKVVITKALVGQQQG